MGAGRPDYGAGMWRLNSKADMVRLEAGGSQARHGGSAGENEAGPIEGLSVGAPQ